MQILEKYNLLKHNTFSMNVVCDYFIESSSEQEFQEFIRNNDVLSLRRIVLGGGSNFLFTEDFEGLVFYPSMKEINIINEDKDCVYVRVGAGCVWDDFVLWAVENAYQGVENMSYIPGHVGAAPVQNVGAYGQEASQTIYEVEALDFETGDKVVISNANCGFSYRNSNFKTVFKDAFLITYVVFKLSKNAGYCLEYGSLKSKLSRYTESPNLALMRQVIIEVRKEKLPEVEELGSAGSFFKNPVVSKEKLEQLQTIYPDIVYFSLEDTNQVKLAAGWLIEKCGWKGKREGNVGVFSKQALVLVNYGGASGCEIAKLSNSIKNSVFLSFGVMLEPEVIML